MVTKAQPYVVLSTLPNGTEIRHYPSHTLISFEVDTSFEAAGNRAFSPLVTYISGANSRGDRMAMTSPVVHEPRGSSHLISFVLPEGTSAADAPAPVNADVIVRDVEPREVAALRFSGSWKKDRAERYANRLRESLAEHEVLPRGEVFFGRFDPPTVPSFLRHNEALVEVESRLRAQHT